MTHQWPLVCFAFVSSLSPLMAGPYTPAAGEPLSDAVAADDASIVAWANAVTITRGPVDSTVEDSVLASYGNASDATGPSDSTTFFPLPVISLGDGGMATATFAIPITDGLGADFAVFENSFDGLFLELAHVEVSSDGINFFRFPSHSLTQTDTQIDNFGIEIDPTDLHNLAGKHISGFGTPFDLAEIPDQPLLDRSHITHVRVIDVVGSISATYGSTDSEGRLINDPFPTAFNTSGFDLDAIAVINQVPSTYAEWAELNFTEGQDSSASADLDKDGLSNEFEFVTGTDPHDHSSAGFTLNLNNKEATLTFVELPERSIPEGFSFVIEFSLDLNTWNEAARYTDASSYLLSEESPASLSSVMGSSTNSISIQFPSQNQRYFRIRRLP